MIPNPYILVVCDGCGSEIEANVMTASLDRALRGKGWRRIECMAACPDCIRTDSEVVTHMREMETA